MKITTKNSITDKEKLYFITTTERAEGYYLASPCAGGEDAIYGAGVNSTNLYFGEINNHGISKHAVYGICPVVCLKSNIRLQKQSDGTFLIIN